MPTESVSTGARWSMLVIASVATLSSFLFINGVAFMIPELEANRDITLTGASLLSSMPSWGMVVTLIAWGYLVDHAGERIVLRLGSALTAAAAFAAASAHSLVVVGAFLFLGGMAAAGANSATGRLVTGWFPPQRRGVAMGIRQTAQPLGIALGAAVIPELAEHGFAAAMMFPAVICMLSGVACALGVLDPPRKPRATATIAELASPYRGSSVLWRIHMVSALLMIPQTVTVTFMLIWLLNEYHWSVGAAGALVTASQLLGALGRILVGRWSDRVGSRMRPVRTIAATAAATLMVLGFTDHLDSSAAVWCMVIASVIAVLDNGLESTAITEFAGPYWSGRALGTQNTTQRLAAAVGQPIFGALIASGGYPLAWAVCGLFPLVAVPLVPARLVPPGLSATAPRRSGRRFGRWKTARSPGWPGEPPPPDPPAPRRRPHRGGRAAAPPT
ncbi:MFS transporter [Mycobacterium xenopi]|uniref:MFS-type transporter n=1 Tax=Mycobacterium xenopi TaxID=1789 RepID=A0AAD1M269_MYCXE|nr:MFS transporter [Mycobacterium xenopi]BBU23602.1 putative MFS-type transporter [Mycobacterium xenopi]SPX89238.1 integral membrane protein [Mycobacterium xenopi]